MARMATDWNMDKLKKQDTSWSFNSHTGEIFLVTVTHKRAVLGKRFKFAYTPKNSLG